MIFITNHQKRLMRNIQEAFAFQMHLRNIAEKQEDIYKRRLLNMEIFESTKYLQRLDAALTAGITMPEPHKNTCENSTYFFQRVNPSE